MEKDLLLLITAVSSKGRARCAMYGCLVHNTSQLSCRRPELNNETSAFCTEASSTGSASTWETIMHPNISRDSLPLGNVDSSRSIPDCLYSADSEALIWVSYNTK